MSNVDKNSKISFGLASKIISVTLVILVAVVSVNYAIFLKGYQKDAQFAMMARASAFTAVADEAKIDASENDLPPKS